MTITNFERGWEVLQFYLSHICYHTDALLRNTLWTLGFSTTSSMEKQSTLTISMMPSYSSFWEIACKHKRPWVTNDGQGVTIPNIIK